MILYEQGPTALALTIAVCSSLFFTFAVISVLATRVANDYKMSKREEYDIFRFIKESKSLLDEYNNRQSRKQLQNEADVSGVSGIADSR